jgi:hypothetical protein
MSRIDWSLGPVFFRWSSDRLGDFYQHIADEASVGRVHVGEVVSRKRMPFSDPVWLEIIERLQRGGKSVALAMLALPPTVREPRSVDALCGTDQLVEINDLTALPARAGRPFAGGAFLNVYNEATAQFLVRRGAECRAYRASYFGLFQSILFVDKLLPALRLTNSSSPPLASRKPALNADIFTDSGEVAFPRPQPATSMHRLPVAMQ